MKILINDCYGGYSPSLRLRILFAKKKGISVYPYVKAVFYQGKKSKRKEVGYLRCTEKRACSMSKVETIVLLMHDYGQIIKSAKHDQNAPNKLSDGFTSYNGHDYDSKELRSDPDMISAFEELGSRESSNFNAYIKMVEIPDGSHYVISDYDGCETIYYSDHEILCATIPNDDH